MNKFKNKSSNKIVKEYNQAVRNISNDNGAWYNSVVKKIIDVYKNKHRFVANDLTSEHANDRNLVKIFKEHFVKVLNHTLKVLKIK